MKLGIFSKIYLNDDLEIALHKIKAQGMSTVQFNFANVGLASLPKEITQEIILQIKEATMNSGVNIAVISGTFNTLELNKGKQDKNKHCFKNIVEAAAALAVPYVSISTGSLNQEDFWSPHPENHTERAWSLLHDSLAWMLEIAEANQVTLVFEPEQANVVSTVEDALRLLRDLDTPYLKLLYDAANLVTPKDHKDLLGKIKKTLTALKDYIAIAHCKDAFVTEEKITFASVGKGNLPLKEYLNELSETYDGPVIMHGLEEDDVTYALNYLNNKLLNIGVLGCGQISQAAHFDSIKRSRNANLYAICDVDEYLLQRMNAIYEPDKVYTDYEQMLADPNVDAVVIGIADQFHVEAVKQAVRAGKHVLVEKPLGVSIEEVEELKELVDRTDLKVQVGNMKRFDPGIVAAKEFVDHEMGEIIGLKAWYCDSTYRYTVTENVQPVIISGKNMKRPAGDPKENKERYYMLGHGSHLFDTARYLGGNIVSVKAWNTQKFGAYCWFITAEFESGFVAQLDLTIAVRMDWHEGFQIYGEFGSVIGKTYNPWTLKSSDVEIFKTSDNSYHRPLGADGHFYRLQIEGFADSVLHHKPGVGATIEDGLATMRAMLAVEESVKTGNTIYLSDVSGHL